MLTELAMAIDLPVAATCLTLLLYGFFGPGARATFGTYDAFATYVTGTDTGRHDRTWHTKHSLDAGGRHNHDAVEATSTPCMPCMLPNTRHVLHTGARVGNTMYDTDVRQDPHRPRMILRNRHVSVRDEETYVFVPSPLPCGRWRGPTYADGDEVSYTEFSNCLTLLWHQRTLPVVGLMLITIIGLIPAFTLSDTAAFVSLLRVADGFGMPSVDVFGWMPLFGNEVPRGPMNLVKL